VKVIAQYLGAFTPTLTLPLEGGGRFFNDFIQLIPSPPGERVRVRGAPRFIEQILVKVHLKNNHMGEPIHNR